MAFNSLNFLLFFPVITLTYFLFPKKIRYIWLLIASYFFYMSWNVKYAGLILLSTCTTYITALIIRQTKNIIIKKATLIICLLINIGILIFYKYFDFIFINLAFICGKIGVQLNIPHFDIILPVGISFYTFQAIGYIMDVYRGEIEAEKNFLKYALFVSFFPQLVAGPIERSKNLLKQFEHPTSFNVDNARLGLFTMAYGLFLKMVAADNIGNVINPILSNYQEYHGMVIAACFVLFAFQIYFDFHGYTQIAIGSAKVLGFTLQENFHSPYCAKNIKEFWKNWHISLTSWFTDYLYIVLGGNRKGKIRKYINTMIVFLSSGLWHGASWAFVVWGGINGIYLILYDITKATKDKLFKKLRINTVTASWKLFTRLITFLLVDYTWIFFRAGGLREALSMQKYILTDFHIQYIFSNPFWTMFGNYTNLLIILFSIIIVMMIDYLQYKGINWKNCILNQQIVFRWSIYLFILFIIFMYGVYGTGNEQTQFIYFQF